MTKKTKRKLDGHLKFLCGIAIGMILYKFAIYPNLFQERAKALHLMERKNSEWQYKDCYVNKSEFKYLESGELE